MHLKYDTYDNPVHAQEGMRKLGITYQHATPQSMGDCWWFWNCENVPDVLPGYLSEKKLDPMDRIGFDLSEEMAIKIRDYFKVDFKEVDKIQKQRDAINHLDFKKIIWHETGKRLDIHPSILKDFDYTGLNNTDFPGYLRDTKGVTNVET